MSIKLDQRDVEKVLEDKPFLKAALKFLKDLSDAQGRLEEYALERLRGLELSLREAAREALKNGVPVVSLTGIPGLREFEVKEYIVSILEVARKHRPEISGDLGRIIAAIGEDRVGILGLAERLLAGDRSSVEEAAKSIGVDPEAMEIAVFWSSQPIFSALRSIVEEELREAEWWRGMCPVCGAYTRISFKDEDGGVWLKCSICGAEWRYPENKCPFCGNDEPSSIDIYTPMRDERFKLYICRKCGRYWKLVNEGKLSTRVSRWLYDAWTRHLDELALRLGLK